MNPDEFVAKKKSDPKLIEKAIMSFIDEQNRRVETGEITAGMLGNTIKAVRLASMISAQKRAISAEFFF